MLAFRAAIEARDPEAVVASLADDVVFRSPVVFTPYRGRDAVEGVDLLHIDHHGLVDDLAVMIRPMRALQALVDAMRPRPDPAVDADHRPRVRSHRA